MSARHASLTGFLTAEDLFDYPAASLWLWLGFGFLLFGLLPIEELLESVHHPVEAGLRILLFFAALLAFVENRLDHAGESLNGIFFLGGHTARTIAGKLMDIAAFFQALADFFGKPVDEITARFADLYDWALNTTTREELLVELNNTKTTPGTAKTWTFLDLGGPKTGWLWDVMRLAINGNDPTATVAGNVVAFIAGNPPSDAAAIDPLGPVIEVGTGTIPNVAFYSRQQVTLHPNQHLVLGMKGLPNSTQLFGGGQVVQYRDPSAGTPANPVRKPK